MSSKEQDEELELIVLEYFKWAGYLSLENVKDGRGYKQLIKKLRDRDERIKQEAERNGRINSIQLYMDTCEENGIDPSWESMHEFQDGQTAAYKDLNPSNKSAK